MRYLTGDDIWERSYLGPDGARRVDVTRAQADLLRRWCLLYPDEPTPTPYGLLSCTLPSGICVYVVEATDSPSV